MAAARTQGLLALPCFLCLSCRCQHARGKLDDIVEIEIEALQLEAGRDRRLHRREALPMELALRPDLPQEFLGDMLERKHLARHVDGLRSNQVEDQALDERMDIEEITRAL